MGEVHLAQHASGELRALKVLSPHAQKHRELTKRFMGEIQVLSYLEHAHVVRFFETGVVEQNGQSVLWLALEYLEGQTLRAIAREGRGRLEEDAIIRWGRQIAQGVHEAHKLRVIHRDLKPENVIVTRDGMAKVIDFGIAKFRDWGDTRSRTSGAKIGTVLYMAPEQLDDALELPIDERTDVYGLGLVLYELACGRSPYAPESRSIDMATLLIRKLAQPAPPVRAAAASLSPELAAIIDRACDHDPSRRFASMSDLNDALGGEWRRRMDARRSQMLAGVSPRGTSIAPPAATLDPTRGRPRFGEWMGLGAALGVATGLVAYRAVVEPRLIARDREATTLAAPASSPTAAPVEASPTTRSPVTAATAASPLATGSAATAPHPPTSSPPEARARSLSGPSRASSVLIHLPASR